MDDITITLTIDEAKVLKSLVKGNVDELKLVLSDKRFPGNPKTSGEYVEYTSLKNILKKLK